MRQVSTQELKKHLSAVLAEAVGGAQVLITRHKRPVAQLGPADLQHIHVGSKFGNARLKPLFQAKICGKYLELLSDDRAEADRR